MTDSRPKFRYGPAGEVLWLCGSCQTYRLRSDFPTLQTGRRGGTCAACVDTRKAAPQSNTQSFPLDAFLRGPCPMPLPEFGEIVWMQLRHNAGVHKRCYARGSGKGRHRLKPQMRARVLRSLWQAKAPAFGAYKLEMCWALATGRLTPAAMLWFALRPGLLDKPQLRLLAVGWALYAARLTGLYNDPEARRLIDDAMFDTKQLSFSEGTDATLHRARQRASDLMALTMRPGVFFPKDQQDAVMAVSATTLPITADAAFAALNWAYSAAHPTPPPPIPYPFVPGDFGKTTTDPVHNRVFKELSRLVVSVAGDLAQLLEERLAARLRREAKEIFDDNVDPASDLWD